MGLAGFGPLPRNASKAGPPAIETDPLKYRSFRIAPTLITAGSSLKFCLVAEGAADLYPRLGTTMEWDTAAGQLIVEEAGGRVVEAASNSPLRYNKADLRNPHFIVSGR